MPSVKYFPHWGKNAFLPVFPFFAADYSSPVRWRGVKRSNEEREAKAFQPKWLCRKGDVPQEQADTAVKFP